MDHHPHVERMNQLRLKAQEFFSEVVAACKDSAPIIEKDEYSDPDSVDIGWCFREIAKMADEIRKEADAKQAWIGRRLSLRRSRAALSSNEEESLIVHGQFARGQCDVKYEADPPKPGTPEYESFCRFLGLPESTIGMQIMAPRYKVLSELVTRLAGEGKKLPDGISSEPRSVFTTTYVTKKQKAKENEDA